MWQAVGMSQAGLSNRRVARQMGVHHSVIDCLMHCLQATGIVDEHPRSDRAQKTTPREDRLKARCARRNCLATSVCI